MSKTGTVIIVVIIAVLALVAWEWRYSPIFSQLFGATTQGQLIAQAHYQCDGGKTIDASYYGGGQSASTTSTGQPVPTGSVQLTLSDNRAMTLPQTISADGTRYANADESFVFWGKGNGAIVLENNQEQSFTGCIQVQSDPGGLPQVYESGSNGFSLRYPANYTAVSTYTYQEMGPGKSISGVKFSIDPAIATGTNLSTDSYVSVEEIPNTTSCTADKFLAGATASVLDDGTTQYSYASSTDAGAGNRYEEQVFALPGTNPCIAVRYFIHYGAIENYPAGAVTEFNHDALVSQFDAIRKTLTIVQ
jgi:membrane-bound inhibitor of C-type lysozyme